MKCPDPGFIQSFLDGEISREDRKNFSLHLDQCSSCREMVKQLKDLEEWTGKALKEGYPSISNEKLHINVDRAWFDFQNRLQVTETGLQKPIKKGGFTLNNKAKKWVVGSAAAIVIASSFTIPQVRAAASDFLSNFRMQQVEFVKLTQEDIQQLSMYVGDGKEGKYEIKGIGTLVIEGNKTSKHYSSAVNAQNAGIQLPTTPAGMTLNSVGIESSYTICLTLDTVKANKMLKQMNAKTQFDNKLNGKVIKMTVPESIQFSYRSNSNDNTVPSDHLQFQSFAPPKIDVPEDVNINQLHKTILSLPFIPFNVRSQLASIENWQETLPIPYAADSMSVQDITINGLKGKYAEDKINTRYRGQFLFWAKNGILQIISYQGATTKLSPAQLTEIAKNF